MGNTCGATLGDETTRAIDRQLARDGNRAMELKKLLLLGAAECGKSTILKQVRIAHDQKWVDDREKEMERMRIYSNIIIGVVQLCEGVEQLHMLLSKEAQEHYQHVKDIAIGKKDMEPFSAQTVRVLKVLWADEVIKKAYEDRAKIHVVESIKFFLESIDRIADEFYQPTIEDYLQLRIQTVGVVEHHIKINGNQFAFIDVGGQKSERKKWISHFENVTAIIFISAVSEYDQLMNEDSTVNRLIDSIALYETTVNNVFFTKSTIILFLNKVDLFKQKIQKKSIRTLFSKYQGSDSYVDSMSFIEDEFLNRSTLTIPYVHYTCATDSDQIQLVINSVMDSIIQYNLQTAGMQ